MMIRNQKHAMLKRFAPAANTLFLLIGLVCAAVAQAQAQAGPSTDRDNPTALTSNHITGNGVDEKTDYFYSVAVKPGMLTATLEVKADKNTAVSSVDIAIIDGSGNNLLSTYANPDHGSAKHSVKSISLKSAGILILQVTVSPGVDTFKLALNGSLDLQPPAESSSDAATSSQPVNDSSGATANNGTPQISLGGEASANVQTIAGTGLNQKTERVFMFSAGPGLVTFQLNVKSQAHAAVSSVDVELLNSSQSKQLTAGFANPSFGASRQTILKANLKQKQAVTLKVTVSPGVDTYTLSISGAINGRLYEPDKTARIDQIRPVNLFAVNSAAARDYARVSFSRVR
jgi:hypothetical protein